MAICGNKWLKVVIKMLIGEHDVSLDDKGRLRIPKNLRDDLEGTFYITRGFEKCLLVFPADEWAKFVAKFSDNNMTENKFRAVERFFMGSAIPVKIDGQGRVNISTPLVNFAKLEKECKIIGLSNRAEIWSKTLFEEYEQSIENISDIAEACIDLKL